MRQPWLLLLLSLAILAACGRNDDLEHRVRNYDVVEEGKAPGVTTSLGGQTVPSLTATNVDTTTDLTLLPGTTETAVTETAGPGSLAETLEVEQPEPPLRGAPAGRYRNSPPPSTGAAPVPARTAQAPDPRPRSEPAPAAPPRRAAPARPTEPAEPAQAMPEPARKAPEENAPERKAPEPEAHPPSEEPPPEPPPTTTSTHPEEPPPAPTTTAPDGSSREVL